MLTTVTDGFELFARDGVVNPAGIVGGAYEDVDGGGGAASAAKEGNREAALFIALESPALSAAEGVPGIGADDKLKVSVGDGGSNAAFIFLWPSGPGDNKD